MKHVSVLLEEILELHGAGEVKTFADLTLGAAGHTIALLNKHRFSSGIGCDQDPRAVQRSNDLLVASGLDQRLKILQQNFSIPIEGSFDLILADLGVSSFQFDGEQSAMSMHSTDLVDFRMNPDVGEDFWSWLTHQSTSDLEFVFFEYGEEPRFKEAARYLKSLTRHPSAKSLADGLANALHYRSQSRAHPATRCFQALRIGINNELGALEEVLAWAPGKLAPGGKLAVISFHSLEDRVVKLRFRDLVKNKAFVILNKKPIVPSDLEIERNPRSRSAKLRVLERITNDARISPENTKCL